MRVFSPSSASLIAGLLLALTGCGGGGGSSAVSPASAPAVGALGATVSVTIPAGTTSSSAPSTALFASVRSPASPTRKPQYLTSYTQGIDLQAVQGGVASGYVFYPLSALQTYCTTQSGGYVCNLKVMVPPGNSQLVVNTYDGTTKATSNMLSTATVNISASPSSANAFSVATNPIAAQLNTNSATNANLNCPTIGTPQTLNVAYTTLDADGGSLTGTLGDPFKFSIVDPAGTITPPAGVFTGASGTFTVSYNGGTPTSGAAFASVVSTTSNAAGVANGTIASAGITPLKASPAGPHLIYVADQTNNQIDVFDICQQTQSTTLTLPGGTGPTDVVFDRYSWGTNNAIKHLVVMGSGNNTLVVVDAVGNSVLQTVTLSGTPHHMQGTSTDSAGDALFVTVNPSALLKFQLNATGPNYLSAPGNTASVTPATLTVGSGPRGFNLEGVGNEAFVAVGNTGDVRAINPTSFVTVGSPLAIGVNPSGVSGPSGDGLCALLTDQGNNTVSALKVQASGSPTQIGSSIALPGTPQSVSFFPLSNTGIVSTSAGAVLVNCSGGTSFSQSAIWTPFMSSPAANVPSDYAYPSSGRSNAANTTSVFVAGNNAAGTVVQAYNYAQNTPLFTFQNGSGTFTGVTSGP